MGTLVATAQSLPKPEICTERAVSNIFKAQLERPYILSLKNADTTYFFAGNAKHYSWQDCKDGTAEFYASGLTSPDLEGDTIELYFLLSEGTKDALFQDEKENDCWQYKSIRGILTSSMHGIFTIESGAEAFYSGLGLNQTDGYSASGEINLFGGNAHWTSGKIEIALSENHLNEDGLISGLYLNTNTQQYTNMLTEGAILEQEDLSDLIGISAQTTGAITHLRYTLSGPLNDELTVGLPNQIYKRGARLVLLDGKYTLTVQAFLRFETYEKLCAEKTVSFQVLKEENKKHIENQHTTELNIGEEAPKISDAILEESTQY